MWSNRVTTGEVLRIELKSLLQQGFLKKGAIMNGISTWRRNNDGNKAGSINIVSYNQPPEDPYIQLNYTITTPDGKKTDHDYKIYLMELPSNLGKGTVLYFICPTTYKPCRILYKAYGSHIFASREAYPIRIYYETQLDPHRWRANSIYWRIDKQLEKLYKMRATYTYKGKPTKRALRIDNLLSKQEEADRIRWSSISFPKRLMRSLYE